MLRYAAYGSNLHPLRLGERLPGARLIGSACVPDVGLAFDKRSRIDGSGKCRYTERGDGLWVAVYALNDAHRSKLDAIEGVGAGYDYAELDVPGFGPCLTYRAQADWLDATLAPFHWYRDIVALGAEFLGFPATYVQSIEAVRSIPDPDPGRAERQQALIERLRIARAGVDLR